MLWMLMEIFGKMRLKTKLTPAEDVEVKWFALIFC